MEERPEKMIPSKIIGFKSPVRAVKITSKDAIIYALSLNYSENPLDPEDLHFTYELDDQFRIAPSFASVFHQFDVFELITANRAFPDFNPMMILHGENSTEVLKPIREGTYYSQGEFIDVQDKGKGALVVARVTTSTNEDLSDPTCYNIASFFIRGQGGFSPSKGPQKAWISVPSFPQGDFQSFKHQTNRSQAILYRLNGDYNPLHVDLQLSEAGGFERPILHGLCTYGIACKTLLRHFLNNEVSKMKRFNGRFTGFVYPGDSLIVDAVKKDNLIIYRVKSEQSGKEVLSGSLEIRGGEEPKL